jgi:hypothetical protein
MIVIPAGPTDTTERGRVVMLASHYLFLYRQNIIVFALLTFHGIKVRRERFGYLLDYTGFWFIISDLLTYLPRVESFA